MRTRGFAALLLGWTFFFARDAGAEEVACPSAGSPWVRVVLEGAYFAESLRGSVLRQIATDLERRGLTACVGAAAGEPVAEIRITLARPALLSIELRDQVSHERFAREISLAGVPQDARGLSIAATAEELLYASWAQNALVHPPTGSAASSGVARAPPSTAPTPAAPPTAVPPRARSGADASSPAERPPERAVSAGVETFPESSNPRAAPLGTQVYFLGAGEAATQGATALGADLGFAWGGRATFGARAGFRLAPEISSPHGTIGMREGILRLALAVALVPRTAAWGGEVVMHGDLLYVEFDGVASSAARALSGSGIGVVLGGGLGGWVRVARSWSIVSEATGGFPIHAVTASDTGTTVTGIRGLMIGFALGVATRL